MNWKKFLSTYAAHFVPLMYVSRVSLRIRKLILSDEEMFALIAFSLLRNTCVLFWNKYINMIITYAINHNLSKVSSMGIIIYSVCMNLNVCLRAVFRWQMYLSMNDNVYIIFGEIPPWKYSNILLCKCRL